MGVQRVIDGLDRFMNGPRLALSDPANRYVGIW